MHTIGKHKRLSLAREEGDPTKCGAGSDFGGAWSVSGLFRHKLSPAYWQPKSPVSYCKFYSIFVLQCTFVFISGSQSCSCRAAILQSWASALVTLTQGFQDYLKITVRCVEIEVQPTRSGVV